MSPTDEPIAEAMVPLVGEKLGEVRQSNVLFNVVVLVVIAIMGGLNAWEARKAAGRVDRATECLIEQFAEHRAANEKAHKATAEKLGTTYPATPEGQAPPDVLERLARACEPFIRDAEPPAK